MTRSRKHKPINGNCTPDSDKKAKRYARKGWRKRNKDLINQYWSEEDIPHLELEETSNEWGFPKDEKRWFGPDEWDRIMRK